MNTHKVVVIGGGIAGMETSSYLSSLGHDVVLIENSNMLGGKLLKWHKLFPTFSKGSEIIDFLQKGLDSSRVEIKLNTHISQIDKLGNDFRIFCDNGDQYEANAIVVCTGYDLFDARLKEEYGYGIYENVITSAELESMFNSESGIVTASGAAPKKIGFVHCVGSRDEKAGHTYCSKVCCVTGVKQAIEVKELLPNSEVYNMYMDLRMFGMHFESMYKNAQEVHKINFIRGRLSEAGETIDGKIQLKVEDTLIGKPLKLTVDLLVLLVGIVPSEGSKHIGKLLNLETGVNGFYKSRDQHSLTSITNVKGIFMAGACIHPRTINNVFNDARTAALMVHTYLNESPIEQRITELA